MASLRPKDKNSLIFVKGDLRKTGNLIDENVVGSSTSAVRGLLTSDASKIAYVNKDTGNDSNLGTSGSPFLTQGKADTEIAATSKTHIEWQVGAIPLSTVNPVQLSIGQTGNVAPSFGGGATSTPTTDVSLTNAAYNIINKPGTDTFIIIDSGGLTYKSTDGGDNWATAGTIGSFATVAVLSYGDSRNCTYTNSGRLIVFDENSGLYYSDDDAATWSTGTSPFAATTLESALGYDPITDTILAVSQQTGATFGTSYSVNDGVSWTHSNDTGYSAGSGSILCPNIKSFESGAFYICEDRLWRTIDNGANVTVILFQSGFAYESVFRKTNGDVYGLRNDGTIYILPAGGGSSTETGGAGTSSHEFEFVNSAWLLTGNNCGFSADDFSTGLNAITDTLSGNITNIAFSDNYTVVVDPDTGLGNIEFFSNQLDIQNDLCGFDLDFAPTLDNAIQYLNMTFGVKQTFTGEPTINNCRFDAGFDIGTGGGDINNFTVFNTLSIGNNTYYSTPTAPDTISINQSTIIGNQVFNNSGYAGTIQIRDNIFEGDISAESAFQILSGNLRGDITTATVTSSVTSDDPLFIDLVDYELQYEVLGYDFDSSLTKASIYYDRSDGVSRDLGCYNIDDSQIVEQYLDAQYLTRPNSYQIDSLNESRTERGKSGIWDGYNDAKMRGEQVVLNWSNMSDEDLAFWERQELRLNPATFLSLYPFISTSLQSLVADGTAAVGDVTINIDSTAIYYGDILTITGIEYNVLYGLDANNKKTTVNVVKVVLDAPLQDAIIDNQVINRKYPKGQGNYIYDIQKVRPARKGNNTGLKGEISQSVTIRLVRDNGTNS